MPRPRPQKATASPEALDILAEFKKNRAQLDAIWEESSSSHPNEWVAVISSGPLYDEDYRLLLERLEDKGELSTAAIDYLSTEDDRFMGST